MTSRVETPAEGREEKGKGVGRRLLSRMKTVLKRSDQSKRQSTVPATQASQPLSSSVAAGPSTAATAAPAASQAPPQVDTAPPKFQGEKIPRAQVYGERYQKFSQYGLEVDPNQWYQMEGHVLRINKPHRMRIHRQCHQCGGEVDANGLCGKCNHSFCRQCTRNPPKRTEVEKEASRDKRAKILSERSTNATIVPDWNADPKVKVVLRKPPKPSPQQELVYKNVRQRVRRMCCQCQDEHGNEVLFQGAQRKCPKCDHVRCTDCPRDPPKKNKYPYGYPGDEFGAKSIPHHKCHECRTKFPPGVDNGIPCTNCSHEKCDNCERLKPQKVEPEPDAEVMRSVQERLAALSFP